MVFETLETTTNEWIQVVKLNRPKLNAMNDQFFKDIKDCFQTIKSNGDVRCVVLVSSFPRAFTAGLDLKENTGFPGADGSMDPARAALEFQSHLSLMQEAFNAIENCNKPVIVGISGICIGGGIDLITAADIRLCTKDALFSIREVDVGLAADLGTLQRLPKIVGNQGWVREVCLTARDFGGLEAAKEGLVTKVCEDYDSLLAECMKLAKVIASKAPLATYGTKHLLNYSRDHSVSEGLQYTNVWNSVMLNSPDTIVAATSALTKKPGQFAKL